MKILPSSGGAQPSCRIVTGADTNDGAMKFVVTLEQDEDGYIVAGCPTLPGCYSQGRSGIVWTTLKAVI